LRLQRCRNECGQRSTEAIQIAADAGIPVGVGNREFRKKNRTDQCAHHRVSQRQRMLTGRVDIAAIQGQAIDACAAEECV